MKLLNILFISMSLFSLKSAAQNVENSAYNILLKGLLSHSVPEISVQKAAQLQEVIFIDSREKNEFNVSHIKNALWVGYDQLDLNPLKKIDKSTVLVIYCSVGYRSEKIAEKLKKQGFTNLFNLYGGIFEWKNQGMPVFNSNNEQTENVHAYNKVWGIWLNKGNKIYNE